MIYSRTDCRCSIPGLSLFLFQDCRCSISGLSLCNILKMEITIPYQEGLLLGRSVDMRTLRPGYMLIREAAVPKPEQVHLFGLVVSGRCANNCHIYSY